jgi:hypothetical protein
MKYNFDSNLNENTNFFNYRVIYSNEYNINKNKTYDNINININNNDNFKIIENIKNKYSSNTLINKDMPNYMNKEKFITNSNISRNEKENLNFLNTIDVIDSLNYKKTNNSKNNYDDNNNELDINNNCLKDIVNLSNKKEKDINSIIIKYSKTTNKSNSNKNKEEEKKTFEILIEENNKKINDIDFSFEKNNEISNLTKSNNNKSINVNEKDNSDLIIDIYNKKLEEENQKLLKEEKSKFDFIFKNKENIENLLFKFKLKEKFSLNDSDNNNSIKLKDNIIKKINFIEEKLNRIDKLIKFEECENMKKLQKEKEISMNKFDEKNNINIFDDLNQTKKNYEENFTFGDIDKKQEKNLLNKENNKNNSKISSSRFEDNINNLKNLRGKNILLLDEMKYKYKSENKNYVNEERKKKIKLSIPNYINNNNSFQEHCTNKKMKKYLYYILIN